MKFTLEQLRSMKSAGKIRGFAMQQKKEPTPQSRIVAKHFTQKSKEKDWISFNLLKWCNDRAYILHEEFRFDKNGRKWRFDWFIPAIKTGIEYNGIFSAKSRHTTVTGYTGDMNKLNAAQAQGYRVLQFTPMNYQNLLTELNSLVT